jgi:hypothetical protein
MSKSGSPSDMQAFRWNRADADMTFLGALGPVGGGDLGDNSGVAYTIANNGVTAGRSHFGGVGGGSRCDGSVERACSFAVFNLA